MTKKVVSFHLALTLHVDPYRFGRVKRKKSIYIKPLICVGVCFVWEIWTNVFITRLRALWQSQQVAEKSSLWQNLSSMWSKWWHLPSKESLGVMASGSGVLYPPVTDCKIVHRLSNTLPAIRFRHILTIHGNGTCSFFSSILFFNNLFFFCFKWTCTISVYRQDVYSYCARSM